MVWDGHRVGGWHVCLDQTSRGSHPLREPVCRSRLGVRTLRSPVPASNCHRGGAPQDDEVNVA